jgi:hypothetical protein
MKMLNDIREKESLPKGTEDMDLPTQIAKVDGHLAFLKTEHDRLAAEEREFESERVRLIARAKEVRVFEDQNYKIIDCPVYQKKHVDVEVLKRLAPDKHNLIVQNLQSKAMDKLKEQMSKIQISIAQADVKAVISDKGLLAQIIPEQSVPIAWTISVVKK